MNSINSKTYNNHMLLLILVLATLITVHSSPIYHKLYSSTINYNESVTTKSLQVPHIENPIVLYSISSIQIQNYFSYHSNYTIKQATNNDTFSLTALIMGVDIYQVKISFVFMQDMPNIEFVTINLTMNKEVKSFPSKKNLIYDTDIAVSAHLKGFSSSKLTNNIFFYAKKFNSTYVVFTNSQLNEKEWAHVQFMIMKTNYNRDNVICTGSYVNTQSSIDNKRSPLKVEINHQLDYFLGIQSIFLPSADFRFNSSTDIIQMNSAGVYSFSVIIINTTCTYVYNSEYYTSNKNKKIYTNVMIVFIVLFVLSISVLTWFYLRKRCFKGNPPQSYQAPDMRDIVQNSQVRYQNQSVESNEVGSSKLNTQTNKSQQDSEHLSRRSRTLSSKQQYIQNQDISFSNFQDAPGTEIRLQESDFQADNKCQKCLIGIGKDGRQCSRCEIQD